MSAVIGLSDSCHWFRNPLICYDSLMKNDYLEPGILKIFRFFLWLQLLLVLVNVAAHTRLGIFTGCPWHAVIFGSINILLLLGYLSCTWLHEKLGKLYLPISLVYAAVFSLVLQNLFLDIQIIPDNNSNEETAWQLFLFLFIPLVLVSWQYNFKAVIAYCIFTAVLDYLLMVFGRKDSYLIYDTYGHLVFIRAFSFLIVGYVISHIMKRFRQQRKALQQANLQIAHHAALLEQLTVSRERNRMARELHDTLAHTLSGIAVHLTAAESLWDVDAGETHAMLSKSLTATRSGLAETRRALQALRASPLDDLGLDLALRGLADSLIKRTGLSLEWQVPDSLPEIAPDIEQGIYRIAQESFENIIRHAEAGHVHVVWKIQDGFLNLSITDDGRGFVTSDYDNNQHYGLCGMKERAQMMGGNLFVESQPGHGTEITLNVKVRHGACINL